MSVHQIRNRLDEVLYFLQPYMSFVNCHMVSYLSENLWEQFIPKDIKHSIQNESDIADAIETFWMRENVTKSSALSEFMNIEKYYLENFDDILGGNDLKEFLHKGNSSSLSIKEFMSEKKRHEVEITADLISNLVEFKKNGNEIYIVDAGDGKGYLSSRLTLQNQMKVLGIDANEVTIESARKRNKKLERAWDGLTQRAILIKQGLIPPSRRRNKIQNEEKFDENLQPKVDNYKLLNEFITPNLDLVQILRNNFVIDENPIEVCLCGLHTCGNLASTCLKMFIAQKDITILCNIGCCYHLLNEEFSERDSFINQKISEQISQLGFPMSEYLRSKNIKLGRNARMLASQSIHRTIKNKELPNKSLLYRALLQILIEEYAPEVVDGIAHVGKIKRFTTFRDYVEKCDKKLNLNLGRLEDSVFESLVERYRFEIKLLDLFYLIRMKFAPILETVILLDRFLYLKENSIERSFLVSLFDPVVSPRCFAIVAIK